MLLSELAASNAADAVTLMLGGGTLRIYDTDDVTLATLTFSGRAFRPAQAGVALANPIAPDTDAPASGTAVRFACLSAKGVLVFEGAVGTELKMKSAEIRQGAEVSVEEFKYTEKRG